MAYSLGIDIGSVNAKLALTDASSIVVHLDVQRITSSPRAAVASLIARLGAHVSLEDISAAGVSGSGKGAIPSGLSWAEYSSSLSIASGLLHSHPDARTIVQIGGQSSFVIALEDGLKRPWKVASNPLCAAGTGRFLEQQAYRLGISLDDFSRMALEFQGTAPRIAARCSVFAKTDLIHLQQKGVPLPAMLYALCGSISRMVVSLQRGAFQEPIYFVGGVAANKAMARSLNEVLSARNGHDLDATIPDSFLYVEAIGASLLASASGKKSIVTCLPQEETGQLYFETPPLRQVVSQNGTWVRQRIDRPFKGYLGVDVGSTSTKAVILDEAGKTVVAKSYLMTAGRPVDAVKQVFRNLILDVGENARIAGAGVTGSGRYLIGSLIGADLVKNEITAQTRAGADLDPEADIIEIGGQDSKLVIKRNGVVVDYQMNKACAAGTGSFIDELAEQLGVRVDDGQFASLAFAAPHTITLGTRCAAFMEQAVSAAQQGGVSLEIIAASLANSIAGNYLSKVVETRKLGNKIILTGAVFYNGAVVSAFEQALPGKTIIVPEHKEVSGAIGAALLAKEEMQGRPSKFRGFQEVADSDHRLSTFTCKSCDNNCTISRLEVPGETSTFYGSRCDKYDSTVSHERVETSFDTREKLLLKGLRQAGGTPSVGIPRALLIYDYAPLFIGFLNSLGAQVVLSGKTNKHIMEQSTELSYTDSCFPLKLLHGHASTLGDVDYVLFPSAIRLGLKDGDENQKYSCPLVQAAPFILREALDLDKRLVIPTIDFSRGDEDVVGSLAEAATQMGFSRRRGKIAALAGIGAQREFEAECAREGKRLLEQIRRNNQLGVVIFARSYMSQDAGANLGISDELVRLGVVPIPLDFLPLDSVNVKEYSDRPYWMYEGKHIAGAVITERDPLLYGLVLTNFGCGPNSFILNLVADIMGNKPLGQLEIDEHAAEAGLITRLEAYVDTIKGFSRSANAQRTSPPNDFYRTAPVTLKNDGKFILIPRMATHAEVLAAAMQAFGTKAVVLPEPDQRNLVYSNKMTSGKECLPYRVTLGDFVRFYYEGRGDGIKPENAEGFMASAFGPCRFGKYAVEQIRLLREIGFEFTIRTTVSNTAYSDLNLGLGFEKLAWRAMVAVDSLERLLWRTRPYEKSPGSADNLFAEYLGLLAERVRRRAEFGDVLKDVADRFKLLIDGEIPRKPIVGINGEIYLRSNCFANSNLVRACEKAGLEVVVSPIGEWLKYLTHRKIEDGFRDRELKKIVSGYLRQFWQERAERSVARNFAAVLDGKEPSIKEIISMSSRYLSPKCGSEAVMSIGVGVEWMRNPEFAGVISVMPHGCMPGGIVAAMSEKISDSCGKPWISLTYDGFAETNNLVKINNFAEVIRFCRTRGFEAS
ncbi:MAG: acyl-CoA dehydratase activase [Chloroflexi bacterium]|nr:acyl-CoA dehydratase activase [Chloroflexota bacterium]